MHLDLSTGARIGVFLGVIGGAYYGMLSIGTVTYYFFRESPSSDKKVSLSKIGLPALAGGLVGAATMFVAVCLGGVVGHMAEATGKLAMRVLIKP